MTCEQRLYNFLCRFIVLCAATLTLAACGGGGGSSSPAATPTITGLAATGAALASAAVTANCTSGAPVAGTTGADGSFSLELAGGQTVPCMLQAVKGTVTLHGFAADAGHTNITPLTDLVISRALGSDAAAAFAAFDASKGAAISAGLDDAKTYVKTEVAAIAGGSQSGDPLTGVFKVGDADDKVLDNLAAALVAGGKNLDDLRLASVSKGSFAAAVTVNWFFSDGAALTPSQIASFDAQGLYFNVHSAANPGGEIRSQIIPSALTFVTDAGNPVIDNAGSAATSNTFSALLSGDQEVPATTTNASAYGTIALDPVAKTISGVLVANGIVGTAAHIHKGLPGVAGPVVFPLSGGPTVWTLAPTSITDVQIVDLKAGAYYLNVHSSAAPAGEIRGRLSQQLRFAKLSGANEVPAVATTASGTGVLALNPTTNQISGFVKTTGITGTAAHIHEGAAGVAGGVIVPLTETPAGSGVWVVPAGQLLTAAQVSSFNAGNLYFNVHSAANGGGEIRDQIMPATIKVGTATLDGSQEVPAVSTNAKGAGILALNSITGLVSGNISTTGIVGTAAHIHAAAAGVNGGVIVPLTLTPPASTFQNPVAVSTTSLADGTVGSAYSQTLASTGGTTPYTWALTSGTLPAGLSLSAAGVISGTPTAAGSASFSVSVSDSATPAATASKALSLNVTAAAVATVSFATQIQPIFTDNCVTACHNPVGIASFMNLSAGNAYASQVQSSPLRVIPGSSATSMLYGRVSGAVVPQMPLGGPPLSAADQTLIKNWIDQGAANN
jgi:hypothetical protein